MEKWLTSGYRQVNKKLAENPDFISCLEDLRAAEQQYLVVLAKLPEEDRILIEEYITLLQEVEYQRTCAAYSCND